MIRAEYLFILAALAAGVSAFFWATSLSRETSYSAQDQEKMDDLFYTLESRNA